MTDRPEEETRRLLAIIQNRYDMRPSHAGRFLHEIDLLAEKLGKEWDASYPRK